LILLDLLEDQMSSLNKYKPFYAWMAASMSALMLVSAGAQENDVSLSELPTPIVQRIEYEFDDTSNVKRVERFPAPKESYEKGSIGRKLSADEWRASQAWQSLAGYNMAKVARFRGMNSMVWCTLRGGGNSVTYMKPLIDFDDHAKLAFYGFRQALQSVFPASKGVDVVYGPDDTIQPVIMNLGEPREVDLLIRIRDLQGDLIQEKRFRSVKLTDDRSPVVLPAFRSTVPAEGHYAVEYEVTEADRAIARTFEFKFFSNNSSANGETDFSGETTVLDTSERVEFLNRYADYATQYFDDPNLDTKVVTDTEVQATMADFKPLPLPAIRTRIPLNDGWASLAHREGEPTENRDSLLEWQQMSGVTVHDGYLEVTDRGVTATSTFEPQRWRFFVEWRARTPEKSPLTFTLGDGNTDAITVAMQKNGQLSYNAGVDEHRIGTYQPDQWHKLRVEVDLHPAYKTFSLYVDGQRVIYAAPLDESADIRTINSLVVNGSTGAAMDDLWGIGYELAADNIRNATYTIATFVDQDFEIKPAIKGWAESDYDTRDWHQGSELPLVIGSERNSGRDLYIRRSVKVGDFERAILNIDALDPGGEIYINGKLVAELNRQPTRLDVSTYLERKADNLLAVRVDHVPNGYFSEDGHTSQDLLYGWFAARMSLDLTTAARIENVVVQTEAIGEPATALVSVDIVNDGDSTFDGKAEIRFTKWFPEEDDSPSVTATFPVSIKAGSHSRIEQSVEIPEPQLWSTETPNLYRVTVRLIPNDGQPIDDFVVTTGIRTIRHENDMLLVNGKPEMLNGATVMQFPSPLEEMSTWHRILPEEWIVKHVLMAKTMLSNTLRIHTPSAAYSDPRFAEYGDQLGLMYIWVPTGWNRKDWAEGGAEPSGPKLSLAEQVAEYVTDIKQVQNHPSIVMWEIFNESVPEERQDMLLSAFHPEMYKTDNSRLITFIKKFRHDRPGVIASTQYDMLGYGKEWTVLRDNAALPSSDLYAVEFAEVTGQDNWNLVKGKPWYRIHSYEWGTSMYRVTGTDPRTGTLRTVVIPEGEPSLN
jgi:hypothetical protein